MAVFSRDVFRMFPGDPNPFDATTTIRYSIPGGMDVRLVVSDGEGRQIRKLVDGYRAPGLHAEKWDGRDRRGRPVTPGTYRCRLVAGPFIDTVELTRVEVRATHAAAGARHQPGAADSAAPSAASPRPQPPA